MSRTSDRLKPPGSDGGPPGRPVPDRSKIRFGSDIEARLWRVTVAGSRTLCRPAHRVRVWAELDRILEERGPFQVVSGGAEGPDSYAEAWAHARPTVPPPIVIKPKWKRPDGTIDRAAGFKRNTTLVEAGDELLAFHDGVSAGTLDTITKAFDLGRPTTIINLDPEDRTVPGQLTLPETAAV
jgi:hypothetical protein